MIGETVVMVINHLLDEADWARSRLAAHAGKRARVESPVFTVSLEVVHGGRFALATSEGFPDLKIDVPPQAALLWIGDRAGAWRCAKIEGDTDFAATLSFLVANLRWDFEEDLSRLLGDVPAHRIGDGLRAAARIPRSAAEAITRSAAEYLAEERRALATRLEAENFVAAVDELRDATERLDKRVQRLSSALAQRQHR